MPRDMPREWEIPFDGMDGFGGLSTLAPIVQVVVESSVTLH